VEKYFLGSVLSGGNSNPSDNLPDTWRKFVNDFETRALQTQLKIPLPVCFGRVFIFIVAALI
jgi:hypothetical protein